MGEGRAREDCSLKAPCCRSCARYVWMQTGIKGQPGEPLTPPDHGGPQLAQGDPGEPLLLKPRQPEPHALTLAQGDPLLPETPAARAPLSPREFPSPQDPGSQSPTLSRSPRATRESPFSREPRRPQQSGPHALPFAHALAAGPSEPPLSSPLHPTLMRSPW